MKSRSFNLIASATAFALGTLFVFTDEFGMTANVVGATGNPAGFTAIIGLFMILSSIGLFIVSMSSTDGHNIDLERLVRRTKNHEEVYSKELHEPAV
ncbi:MAG: hypothetical protein ACP5NW_03550, partial [Candidatus Woesearchaeota archaeon]